MDLAQQLLRQVLLVVGGLPGQTVGVGLARDCLVGGSNEVLGLVRDRGCGLWEAEVVAFVVVLLLHEGQPLEVAGSVDRVLGQ